MISWKNTLAALAASALVAVPVAPAVATSHRADVAPSTSTNALTAMHGEAYAYATYTAYAAQAFRTGHPAVAKLFKRTAKTELSDHFAKEAVLAKVVGTDAANLQDAIDGETYETTTMYPAFAAQATKDGCTAAAELFTEIGGDEAGHAAAFATALQALSDSAVDVPAPPAVDAVTIIASTPACTGATLSNLKAAMHGEAFAHAKYSLYAKHALRNGRPALAALFARTAKVELREHFAGEAVLAGLVRSNVTNLTRAVTGETYEAKIMYPAFAAQAAAVGDRKAARLFKEIGRDESRHARAFAATAARLSPR